jgi:hypothetical protein
MSYHCKGINQIETHKQKAGHTKDCINTAVIFWIVRNLCVFSKYDLTTCCDKPKLGDVDLDDSPFCHDTQLCVYGRLWIFLYT